jgi:hypothetical protein
MSIINGLGNVCKEILSSNILSGKIKEILPIFQKGKGAPITKTVQLFQDAVNGNHYYGFHKNQQMADSHQATVQRYAEIKSRLLVKVPVYQVVGDSGAFSEEGTKAALTFLKEQIPLEAAILYGYTGHDEQDGTKCINAVVSTFITQEKRIHQTFGNLVGFHTRAALDSWGCTGPELSHYFLVYSDDESRRETGTVFGDDIVTSDYFSDQLVMAEGGIQSFRQACNFLLLERPITALANLRGPKTRFALLVDGTKKDYFSAPEFLQHMKENVKAVKGEVSDSLLDTWYQEYLSTRLIADPKRQDYDTKKALLDDAWKLFKTEKLYKRLHLFKCGPHVKNSAIESKI